MSDHPKQWCKVTVTFTDGEIKVYEISAGPGIAAFLAKQAGETGVLILLNGDVSNCVPLEQIKEYEIALSRTEKSRRPAPPSSDD